MSNNEIKIPIVAEDNASKVISKVTTNFKSMSKSIESASSLLKNKFKSAFDSVKKNSESVLKGVGVGFASLTAAIGVAGAAFLALAHSQTKLQNLREIYKGSPEVLERMRMFAKNAGLEFESAQESMLKLGRAFKPDTAEELLKVIGDLRAKAKLDPSGVANLTDELAELGGKAEIGLGDFEKFQKIVGSGNLTFEHLAAASGQSLKDIEKQLKEGTFSAAMFASGLREAGSAGKETGANALEGATKSIDSQLNRIETIWEDFKTNIFDAFGGEAQITGFITTFADGLQSILSKENINKFFKTMGEVISFVADNMKIIKPVLIGLATATAAIMVPAIYSAVVAFGAAVIAAGPVILVFGAIATAVAGVIYYWDDIKGFFSDVGSAIADFASGAWQVLKTVFGWSPLGLIVNNWTEIMDFFKALPETFVSLGSNIIGGLIEGLKGGAGDVLKAVTGIASSAVDAFKDTLGIHSPSKVFEEMGGFTAEGYSQGLDKGSSDVKASTREMAGSSEEEVKRIKELEGYFSSQNNNQGASQMMSAPKPSVTNNNSSNTTNTVSPVFNMTVNIEGNADQSTVKQLNDVVNNPALLKAFLDAISRANLGSAGF